MDQDRLDQAIAFIWGTWRFWWLRGHVAEVARHWEELAAKRPEMAPHERALTLSGTGFTFMADGDQDKAQSACVLGRHRCGVDDGNARSIQACGGWRDSPCWRLRADSIRDVQHGASND